MERCLPNTNRHHLNYEKRQFKKNGILNKLREHPGLIIRMNLFDHRTLHHDLTPPPMPTPRQAEELLTHLGRYDDQSERIDYLDMAVDYIKDQNPKYAGHLLVQRSYVLLSPMTQTEIDIVEMERCITEMGNHEQPRLH